MTAQRRVAIHYHRPPDNRRIYDQRVVWAGPDVIITLSDPLELARPVMVGAAPVLESGSLALWFTFPGAWHDIGRFHRPDGTLTGIYANILTPPELGDTVWHTTDLFLDVWKAPDGSVSLLDEDEFDEACTAGHVDPETATRAREEAARILGEARSGSWPPQVVREWTLERALRVLEGSRSGP